MLKIIPDLGHKCKRLLTANIKACIKAFVTINSNLQILNKFYRRYLFVDEQRY